MKGNSGMCSPAWETDGGGRILERGGRQWSSEAARVFTMGDAPTVNSRQGPVY
jgi:hypothetical protein